MIEVTDSGVEVLMWGKNPQTLPLDALYEVKLTEKEFTEKYFIEAKAVWEACQNKMFSEYAGYHEMYNAWIDYDPFCMAANLRKNNAELLGYFELEHIKNSWLSGTELDIGLVVREGEDTYWCHASKKYLDDMVKEYKEVFDK